MWWRIRFLLSYLGLTCFCSATLVRSDAQGKEAPDQAPGATDEHCAQGQEPRAKLHDCQP